MKKEVRKEVFRHVPTGDHLVWMLRHECHVPAVEIAEAIGTTRAMISKYLNGSAIPSKPKQVLLVRKMEEEIRNIRDFERLFVDRVRIEVAKFMVTKQEMLKSILTSYKKTL